MVVTFINNIVDRGVFIAVPLLFVVGRRCAKRAQPELQDAPLKKEYVE